MSIKKAAMQKILMVCIVVLLVVNILLTAQGLKRLKSWQNKEESLPCKAVPIRFVMDEPECADKLLRSMNVSNVRVLTHGVSESRKHNQSRAN
jgi:hypothetical protein